MKYFALKKNLASPMVITCEHASDFIPLTYKNLGLSLKNLKKAKDLFDPGSLELALALSKNFKASLIYPKFSRLLIDANRLLSASSNKNNTYHSAALKTELLIEDNLGERLITIPGNKVLKLAQEEKRRWHKYVKPYYQEITKLTDQLLKKFDKVYILQIHSFYPKYKGDIRKVDIGVIHNQTKFAKELMKKIKLETDLVIGDNKPWGLEAVGGGVLKPLQNKKNLYLIGLDINNKHLKNKKDIKSISNILTNAFTGF